MKRVGTNPAIAILGPMPPAAGGICTNIKHLLISPLKQKYHFIAFRTGSDRYGNQGYFRESLSLKVLRTLERLISYFFWLAKTSPETVHINSSFSSFSLYRDFAFLALTKAFGVKVVFQFHGGRLDEFLGTKHPIARKAIIALIGLADMIVVLSSLQKEPLVQYGFGDRVRIVPNMIDIDSFHNDRTGERRFNSKPRPIVVLFVSPIFYKRKGVWEILSAAPRIINKHKNVMFIFVGADEEEQAMKEYCRERGLQDYIEFRGRLFDRELIEAIVNADIFVLPSYKEGFPLTILEAMAAGLPVISTPVGAIPEVIEDGINGFLIPPRDSKALAEKIVFLIENKQLCKIMGERNKAKVRDKYDVKPVSEIFDRLYQELINSRRGKAMATRAYDTEKP